MHPDLAAAPAREGEASQVTDAYKTLMSYAEALPSVAVDDAAGAAGYRFDRGAVEGAILVMVRRQAPSRPAEAQP